MASDQQPETWGYGLTWLVTIGLVVLVSFGAFKLTVAAKEGSKHMEAEKKIAEEAGLKALKEKNEKVDAEKKAYEAELKKKLEQEAMATVAGGKGDPVKGKALYMNCMACHGPNGQGNPALKSPPIAGQETWYLKTSINKFLKGIRGGDMAKDPQGGQMAMMVKQFLKTQEDVDNVVAYIQTIKPVATVHSLKGNADLGRPMYATCVACHGDKGQGNPLTKGPKLTGLPDWYIFDQIKKFKSGIRGAHPDDLEGKLMAPMSQLLATDDMIKNVAEYIKTFTKKK